jgi:hypothetical protein
VADILAKRDQQAIDRDPILGWELLAEGEFGIIGSFGAHIPPDIADPMDVGIDTDARQPEADRQREIGGLPPNARERKQRIEIGRNLPMVAFNQLAAHLDNATSLGIVEANRIDQFGDTLFPQFDHGCGGIGSGKEARSNDCGKGVFGSQAQNGGNQNTKGVAIFFGHTVNQRLLILWHLGPQYRHGRMNIKIGHCFAYSYNHTFL